MQEQSSPPFSNYFSSLFLVFFFSDLPFLAIFLRYIPLSQYHPHHTRVNLGLGTSSCPIQHLLELSTDNCKAARSLFRYHIHINAARELVGKHLIWR